MTKGIDLGRFPTVPLCHRPTPLEFLGNLTEYLGGPKIWIKRDDCTGLATGGNKARKLEFLMGDANAQSATCVITQGAVQSNHVRQTAAAAARMGLGCKALLERRVPQATHEYETSGNVALDRLMNVALEYLPSGADMNAEMERTADVLRQNGEKPYIIPGGGSNAIGALGYVSCAMELTSQVNNAGIVVDYIIHATGSAGTQAGLVAGLNALGSNIGVLGISVRATEEVQRASVLKLARQTTSLIGISTEVPDAAVQVDARFIGPGYGIPTSEIVDAISLVARLEGILLDPVYSGKGMAGFIGLIKEGRFSKDDNIVFLHTGGSSGLFGYVGALNLS